MKYTQSVITTVPSSNAPSWT